jgi:AcrR family transcriptional regulator
LSEDEIVTAALRLTREVGLDNLSMRALARELEVPPMTIYHYVTSKESLHGLVVDHILHEIAVPEADDAIWEERLKRLLTDARRVFADHPGVSSRLGDPGTAQGTRLAEGVLAILGDGGFASDAAVVCFATLFTFMTGQIDLDAMADAIVSTAPTTTLEGVTRSTRFSRDELFELGFDAVIQGLKQTLLGGDRDGEPQPATAVDRPN